MTEHTYEPPTLVEIGDFTDLTLGGIMYPWTDVITDAYGW
jgi:hypothetical protein